MGYNTRYTGAIGIEPPLTWAEIKDSPYLPETAKDTWPDVKLRVIEQTTETDEGSPISPVFASSEDLASWMSDPERGRNWVPAEVAAKFIADGWAPSFVGTPQTGLVSGVEFVGTREDEPQ